MEFSGAGSLKTYINSVHNDQNQFEKSSKITNRKNQVLIEKK